ncbi:hypothetical protein PENTCL1PPCAC_30769 [Pristionchus entomophagus]|uniref:Uncharacterized protein n=1 Tax=Pristionchus entomophagus TaxID=358040 RepID=A0AAV5URZ9_9BILA|nr:hypothetical protein PENTCL1PPCAC_30769 [Pristionchus entomophagus]
MMRSLRLLLLVSLAMANLDEFLRYCESYSECVAVSKLEERLCIGNSRHRPYWLPSFHDPKQCYEKLKNDYKLLDHLEVEVEKKYTACLIEQTVPMTEEQSNGQRCSDRLIQDAPRFSFARTISYVPTNCFTGLTRRLEKECGRLKGCCAATNRCHHVLNDSEEARQLNSTRAELWKRARGCERGESIEPLPLALQIAAQNDEELAWAPKGNITFRIRDQETIQRQESERKQAKERLEDVARLHREEEDHKNEGTIKINIHEERKWNADHTMEKSADPKPTLTFPREEKNKETRPPPSIEEHNRMFSEALKNDHELRERLRQKERRNEENTEKKVGDTIDSCWTPQQLQRRCWMESQSLPVRRICNPLMTTSSPQLLESRQ